MVNSTLFTAAFPSRQPLMLCAPKIAGLLPAPKVAAPPTPPRLSTPKEALFDLLDAYFEAASARLQARYAEIDKKVEALRLAYNIRPIEITVTPPKGSAGGAA